MTKRQIGTVIGTTLSFIFCFVSLYSITPLMGNIQEALHLNSLQIGLYTSFYFIGYLISQIPGGILADSYQPKVILILCTAINILSIACMSIAPNFQIGLLLRLMSGIGCGCIMASCTKIIAFEFKKENRRGALGILLSSPPCGILIANTFSSKINESFGYQKTFLCIATLGGGLLALISFLLPMLVIEKRDAHGPVMGLISFFKNRNQIILSLGGAAFMFVIVGFATWSRNYMKDLGSSSNTIGVVLTCYSLFAILGAGSSGYIAKALNLESRKALLVLFPLLALLTTCFALQESVKGMIVFSAILGLVSYFPSTHFTSLAMEMADDKYAATAASSQNLFLQIGSLIMPMVIGTILDSTHSYFIVWFVFVGVCLVAELACYMVNWNMRGPYAD